MIISKEYLKNTFIIAIAFILQKSFNLIIPYFLNDVNFNHFNKVYYYASLVSTIGTFGFTYAITQINFTPYILLFFVVLNVIISYIIVNIFYSANLSIFNIVIVFIISLTSITFNIYNFLLLFYSKTNKYFLTIIIISLSNFASLILSYIFNSNLILFYGLLNLLGLTFCFKFFDKGSVSEFYHLKKFYKIGASTFLINSAAGIVLMADKFISNNLFNVPIANAYTFAWAVVAPIFYLGNVAEKNIYAANGKNELKNSFYYSFILITVGLILYFCAIIIIINYYPKLIPKSIDITYFKSIVTTMFVGYSIYIYLHFPVNGILFKFNLYSTQKIISFLHIVVLSAFTIFYFMNLIKIEPNEYFSLFSTVLTILFILSIIKIIAILILQKTDVIRFFKV